MQNTYLKGFVVALTMLVCTLTMIPIVLIIQLLKIDPSKLQGAGFELNFTNISIVFLFSASVVALIFLVQKFIHKKPVGALGFKGEFKRNFICGHILGFIISGLAVLAAYYMADGANCSADIPNGTGIFEFTLYYVFFLIFILSLNSLKEELVYRSYPIEQFVGQKHLIPYVIIITSLLFSLFHHFLEPFTWGAFIHRFFFGSLAGLLYYTSRSIWGIIGLHNGINWAEITFTGNWKIGGFLKLAGLDGSTISLNGWVINIILLAALLLIFLLHRTKKLSVVFPNRDVLSGAGE